MQGVSQRRMDQSQQHMKGGAESGLRHGREGLQVKLFLEFSRLFQRQESKSAWLLVIGSNWDGRVRVRMRSFCFRGGRGKSAHAQLCFGGDEEAGPDA